MPREGPDEPKAQTLRRHRQGDGRLNRGLVRQLLSTKRP